MVFLKNLLSRFKSSFAAKAAVVAVVLVSVSAVAMFDTYPTYIKKEVVLTSAECSEVATLVAVLPYKHQNPDVAIPKAAADEMAKATRLSKRVANWVLKQSGDSIKEMPPMFVWMQLYQGCMASEGKITLD